MSWGLNWSVRVPRNEHPWLGLEHLSTKEYAAPATMRVCTPKTKATTEREVTRLLIYRFASISFPSTACRFVTCCSPLVNYRRSLSCMHSCSGFLRLTMLNNDKMKGLTALPERGANTWFGWDATQKIQCISTTSNRQRNNRAIMNTCALTGIDLLLCFPLNRYYSSREDVVIVRFYFYDPPLPSALLVVDLVEEYLSWNWEEIWIFWSMSEDKEKETGCSGSEM